MQTSSFEAPQNVLHQEMINKGHQSACLQRTDIYMELMMPGMEGYQGLSA
jgi:CheY-like chemotaxis protein